MFVIKEAGMVDLHDYESVPISFQGMARVNLDELRVSKGENIIGIPTDPFWKHYDDMERPSELPNHFDTSNWATLNAFDGSTRVGGAILAWNSFDFDMLEGRQDLAVMVDIRVRPTSRGGGIGRALFAKALEWCSNKGVAELHVETQDTNLGACCFYSAMGCTLHSVELGAYGPSIDEAKIIWTIPIGMPQEPDMFELR